MLTLRNLILIKGVVLFISYDCVLEGKLSLVVFEHILFDSKELSHLFAVWFLAKFELHAFLETDEFTLLVWNQMINEN